MNGQTPNKLLLMLDALVDSRLGTLNILEPAAVQAMSPPTYFLRTRDSFTDMGIPDELFKAAYAGRDIVTLKNSMLTGIIPIIQNAIQQYTTFMNPTRAGAISIDLNVFPYALDAEMGKLMADLLEFKLGGIVKVNVIRTPYAAMTLSWLRTHYHTFVIYDWVEWACAIEQSFRSETAPAVTVIAPDLLQGEALPEQPDEQLKAAFKAAHPTAYMEFALADYIGLSFERTQFFSMAI